VMGTLSLPTKQELGPRITQLPVLPYLLL
jgi:hypothetical protein